MNPIPWYKSPVFVGALASIISQVLAWLGRADAFPAESVNAFVEGVFQVIALVAAGVAAWKRGVSKVQPLSSGSAPNAGPLVLMLALLFVPLMLSACQSFGVPQPRSFEERIAAAYTTVTTVRQSASVLVNADAIKAADAQNIQTQADLARAGLDIARTIRVEDPDAADAKLRASLQVLNALEAYLRSKSP